MGNVKTRNTWFVKADGSQDRTSDKICTQSAWSQVAVPTEQPVAITHPSSKEVTTQPVLLRRSNRDVRPPSHLMDYVTDIN
ncbi:jg9596 [Pararge aegeria aegeria]|uniref:Jg9596 protein n=1 Tax=Pararge aegeria aegeria TaxID=348720 RepID=A0A8S4S4A4_9NEOP|nr:jg9596 [Pararge aegeria aegeria]